ncbi:MAG: ornithine cyclodeaminase family protein, partial [Alphaproteobacteria bacterium]|nr:ornithine cyclodeaminase family protein [Alphaproteobacteria bacterium]
MPEINLRYLSGLDVDALDLTCDEILVSIEASLAAQGRKETVVEPRMHLVADKAFRGHFNVLRGYIAPLEVAGIKVVSDYIDNWERGLPSEMGLVNLFDAQTGTPRAVVDATAITEMRTGAVTAIGAKYLAPSKPRVLG